MIYPQKFMAVTFAVKFNEFVILFNVNGDDECLALGYSFENKDFKVGKKSSIWDHLCGDKSPVKESLLNILK